MRQHELRQIAPHEIKSPLFSGVEPLVLESFLRAGSVRVLTSGEFVLEEGRPAEHFFILHRGSVRVFYRSEEQIEVVVKLFRAPAAFGEMECLGGIPYLESVQAMETTVVVAVPRPLLLRGLDRSHRFTRNLLADVAARLCIAAQNERALAFHPVETRLANLFSTYVDFYGLPVHGGTKIRIALTQDDLANALGVARRSITRTLKRWAEEQIVVKEGRHFVVRDQEALERVVDPNLLKIGHRLGQGLGR